MPNPFASFFSFFEFSSIFGIIPFLETIFWSISYIFKNLVHESIPSLIELKISFKLIKEDLNSD